MARETLVPRRTWQNILAETKRCAGGIQYAGFEERLKYWLSDAYFRICFTYHHYDLHRELVIPQKAGFWSISMPSDAFIVMSVAEVELVQQTGYPDFYRPVLILQNRNDLIRQGLFRTVSARPMYYSRSGFRGRTIQFDSILDKLRTYLVTYYHYPGAPNFDNPASLPAIERVWDEAIIDTALVRIGARTGVSDLTAQGQMLLSDYLGQQVQPAMVDSATADMPDTQRTDQPYGGLKG